jgi:hypothetical protein
MRAPRPARRHKAAGAPAVARTAAVCWRRLWPRRPRGAPLPEASGGGPTAGLASLAARNGVAAGAAPAGWRRNPRAPARHTPRTWARVARLSRSPAVSHPPMRNVSGRQAPHLALRQAPPPGARPRSGSDGFTPRARARGRHQSCSRVLAPARRGRGVRFGCVRFFSRGAEMRVRDALTRGASCGSIQEMANAGGMRKALQSCAHCGYTERGAGRARRRAQALCRPPPPLCALAEQTHTPKRRPAGRRRRGPR